MQVCGATGLVSPRAQPQEQARTAHHQVCLSPPCHVAHYRLPQHAFLRCTYPLTIASAVAIELAKHGVFFFFFFGLVRTSWFGGVTVMRSVRCRTWLWFRYPLGAKCFTATCTRLTLHMHARPHMPNNGCRCALAHRAAQQRGGVLQAVELFLPRRKEPAGPPRGTHGGWADESWRPYVSFSGPYTDIVIFIVFAGASCSVLCFATMCWHFDARLGSCRNCAASPASVALRLVGSLLPWRVPLFTAVDACALHCACHTQL